MPQEQNRDSSYTPGESVSSVDEVAHFDGGRWRVPLSDSGGALAARAAAALLIVTDCRIAEWCKSGRWDGSSRCGLAVKQHPPRLSRAGMADSAMAAAPGSD
jgi:hypothetical protein